MLFVREQIIGLYYLLIGIVILFLFPLILKVANVDDMPGGHVQIDTLLHDSVFIAPSQKDIRNRPIVIRKAQLPKVLDLNRADSSELVSVRGIGPYYASKIIGYRKKLGGYFDVRQLRELNLAHLNIDSLGVDVVADKELIVKRYVGECDFKTLLSHPYFDYETLQLVFDFKRGLPEGDTLTIKKLSAAGILRSTQTLKLSYYFY